MAIKGKSRKRSRPRTSLPPKPAVGARKTPLPMRKDVKRAAVIVLAVLSLLGGLRVWQNVSRSDALRAYDTKLTGAQEPLFRHLRQDAPTNFEKSIQDFTGGTLGGQPFIALADQWEKDFKSSQDRVKKLKAPNKVVEEAQNLIAVGLDGYVGLARLYNVAGQVKLLAEAEKDAKKKTELNNKVQVILQHAQEWRTQRVDEVYKAGALKLQNLKLEYGLIQPEPAQTPQ